MQKFGFATSDAKNGINEVSDTLITFYNMRNNDIGRNDVINII